MARTSCRAERWVERAKASERRLGRASHRRHAGLHVRWDFVPAYGLRSRPRGGRDVSNGPRLVPRPFFCIHARNRRELSISSKRWLPTWTLARLAREGVGYGATSLRYMRRIGQVSQLRRPRSDRDAADRRTSWARRGESLRPLLRVREVPGLSRKGRKRRSFGVVSFLL
jgi:hypothetical protein